MEIRSISSGVQLILFPFIGVGSGSGGFKFTGGEMLSRNLENVPRRDSAKQIPKEVQLFLLIYFVLGNVYWTFRFRSGNSAFLKT